MCEENTMLRVMQSERDERKALDLPFFQNKPKTVLDMSKIKCQYNFDAILIRM